MLTAKVAPDLSLALARAAGQAAPAVHAPGPVAAGLVLAGLAVAGWLVYRVSLWLHPFAMCRRCGGTGITSGFLPWTRAFCYKCHGRGLVPRFGTKAADAWGRRPR